MFLMNLHLYPKIVNSNLFKLFLMFSLISEKIKIFNINEKSIIYFIKIFYNYFLKEIKSN